MINNYQQSLVNNSIAAHQKDADISVYADQVSLLYKHAPLALVATLLNGIILVVMQWPVQSMSVLITWLSCLLIVTLGRQLLQLFYKFRHPAPAQAWRWGIAYIAGTALAGSVWGSAAVWLFPPGEISYQVFVAFVLAGMSAAAVAVLAALRVAAAAFILPALLPLAVQFLRQGDPLSMIMGALTLMFGLGMLGATEITNRTIRQSLWLHRQNRELQAELASGKEATLQLEHEVSQHQVKEEQLTHLASHDALTELPNRYLLQQQCDTALINARHDGKSVAILFIDLNRFKVVNDLFGYNAGDALLREIANRLRTCMRATDTVARFGGDEFVVVIRDVIDTALAADIAQKVLAALGTPFSYDGQEFIASASVGISLFPAHADNSETLINCASIAAQQVKAQKGNGYQYYHRRAIDNQRHDDFETELRQALKNNELRLHYQPQVELISGKLIGFEALLRWVHPSEGLLNAHRFVPLAEQSNLILELDEWVLHNACSQIRDWQNSGLATKQIAINLSARQFLRSELPQRVAAALQTNGIAASTIELEITETLLIKDVERAIRTLHELKAMGVSLAIDDFGTGYTSLSYLGRFPIDTLKIDRAFVSNVTTNQNTVAIVTALITLAHNLGLKVIAEGVEDASQHALLHNRYCDAAQGYYLSYPLPAEAVPDWLHKRQALTLEQSADQTTILVVDDDLIVRKLICTALQQQGYSVISASSAHEGMSLLVQQRVDAALVDYRLPDLDGVEFLLKVKAISPSTIRILISAHQDFQGLTDAINKGEIFRFLLKPIDIEHLLATMRQAFQQHGKFWVAEAQQQLGG